jgi:hypothetical protein
LYGAAAVWLGWLVGGDVGMLHRERSTAVLLKKTLVDRTRGGLEPSYAHLRAATPPKGNSPSASPNGTPNGSPNGSPSANTRRLNTSSTHSTSISRNTTLTPTTTNSKKITNGSPSPLTRTLPPNKK